MVSRSGMSRRLRFGVMAITPAGSGGSTGNAKDMGWRLENRYGFRKVSSPVVGAIVGFQPSFGQVNTTYGHVGRVIGVSDSGGS